MTDIVEVFTIFATLVLAVFCVLKIIADNGRSTAEDETRPRVQQLLDELMDTDPSACVRITLPGVVDPVYDGIVYDCVKRRRLQVLAAEHDNAPMRLQVHSNLSWCDEWFTTVEGVICDYVPGTMGRAESDQPLTHDLERGFSKAPSFEEAQKYAYSEPDQDCGRQP